MYTCTSGPSDITDFTVLCFSVQQRICDEIQPQPSTILVVFRGNSGLKLSTSRGQQNTVFQSDVKLLVSVKEASPQFKHTFTSVKMLN